ncbi:hypothetical protein LTR60_000291 [Cryomyces antarcticus]|nr:hypothetical protein LTR60_000291 [Cryomyces antarcticus]
MAASLLGLLKELLDNITDDLGHASILALRSTCKQPHATVSHHNNVRIKEPLNGQRTYTISDLLEIERWPCYDSAEQREDGLKQAVAELDSFACFICLKIRSAGYFSNAMMKARRACLHLIGLPGPHTLQTGTPKLSNRWYQLEMLGLRTSELKIHYDMISMGNVGCLGNQVLCKEIQFTMPEFRSMVHGLVTETRRMLMKDLLSDKQGKDVPKILRTPSRDNPIDERLRWRCFADR